MSDNPYAPPTAHVADVEAGLPDNSNPLFAVGTAKLVILSVCTFGMYPLYWFYRNWNLVRAQDRSDIMPVMRAIFAIFFCYSLFKRFREEGEKHGIGDGFAAGPMATAFIVLQLSWRLPEPIFLIGFGSCAVLGFAQQYVNKLNLAAAPNHERNDRFTGWNWAAIVLGGIFLSLVLIGLLVPDPDQ